MLLKYQQDFLNSTAKIKVWEKSRQIGATWTIASNSCLVSGRAEKPYDTWFSSSNKDAGKLFIGDVGWWAKRLHTVINTITEDVLINKADNNIKATVVEFSSGKNVYALSSEPKNLRGKRGDIVLDEFAFHDNQRELWKAATPITRWGGTVYALSSVGTENDFFSELASKAKEHKNWYYQRTTIEDAINDGIVEAIWLKGGNSKKPSAKDKDKWLQDIRDECLDEETFLQEYMCVPIASSGDYWLAWDLITGVESNDVHVNGSSYKGGKTILGHDVARRGDKSVFVVFEIVGDVAYLVDVRILTNQSFANQAKEMQDLMAKYNPFKVFIDKTGMGEKVVEDYQIRYGKQRVEGVLFTPANKQDMAVNAKQIFEDKKIRLPFANNLIRTDLRKIKKIAGAGNMPKFDTEKDKNGHGDIAWAIFLALLGLKKGYQPYKYERVGTRTFRGQRAW